MYPTPAEDRPLGQELPDPKEWLDLYGDTMYRFALARLRRPHDAEEAVQEALLAALRARSGFQGRSQPRTWLLGILKNKVHSRLRAQAAERAASGRGDLDQWFDGRGKWRRPPRRWSDPADEAEWNDFWRVLRRCLSGLPARMAAAFTLRALDEVPAADVCRELGVTADNFWVLLHRARVRLVGCLQANWFGGKAET